VADGYGSAPPTAISCPPSRSIGRLRPADPFVIPDSTNAASTGAVSRQGRRCGVSRPEPFPGSMPLRLRAGWPARNSRDRLPAAVIWAIAHRHWTESNSQSRVAAQVSRHGSRCWASSVGERPDGSRNHGGLRVPPKPAVHERSAQMPGRSIVMTRSQPRAHGRRTV
jgi:hypothetical protein